MERVGGMDTALEFPSWILNFGLFSGGGGDLGACGGW